MKRNWYKILAVIFLLYAIIAGFLVDVPETNIQDSMRNVFFHVGMWFAMLVICFYAMIYSINYLSSQDIIYDIKARESVNVGIFFGIVGIITGMAWAKFTWGVLWANDPHLNGAIVSLMAYFAYLVLRSSIPDTDKAARTSAVYNIFAFVLLLVFIGVLPRLSENTLHPGSKDGNPAFGDMDAKMRYVFYPALLGWIMLGVWIMNVRIRYKVLQSKISEDYDRD